MTSKKNTPSAPIHPIQTEAWANFRQSMGVTIKKTSNGYVSFHRIPHTPYTIGYFPKGNVLTKKTLEELRNVGHNHQAIFIQIEPNILVEGKRQIPHDIHLKPSHHPLFTRYTFVIDLTKTEEQLLRAMHPKTRYNIRVAQKHGVQVTEDNSDAAFSQYLRLEEETTARQKFYAHNSTYHRTMWRIMRDAGIAHLWTASYDHEVLAAWIIFVYDGIMYYPYGASSRLHKETMAPNVLLWELMKWGKNHDVQKFDLWGAMGPNPDPKDPWYGFHRFKVGYAPELVEFVGSYDLVLKPSLYTIYCAIDTVRWMILKLSK